jgi:zinc/manganese transport system permease protein
MFSGFMTDTWVVATMVAAAAGAVGFFVVIRNTVFAAHALPLGTFPGAAADWWRSRRSASPASAGSAAASATTSQPR